MGKLIVRIASLLLIAAFLPTAVLAAEWNLENGSIEITATANPEGGTTQTVSQGGSSAEDIVLNAKTIRPMPLLMVRKFK